MALGEPRGRMIHYFTPANQRNSIGEYLELWGRKLVGRIRVRRYEELLGRGRSVPRFGPGTYVLSALDQLAPGMLRLVAEMQAQLHARGGFRFLNDPIRTLRRYDLLTELKRQERNDFRAVRATGDLTGLTYPVFLRAEGSHEGALSPLLRSAAEIEDALGRAIMRGRRPRDLLVIEFCPTGDPDGRYRKYAAFVVGERIIPRSVNYGREWVVKHQANEYSRRMVLEEREYVFENPHAAELAEIARIARVGYGRIDYSLKDDRIQTWEINLHPTIGRGRRPSRGRVPVELEPIRQESKECFYAAFQEAWEAVDEVPAAGPSVTVDLETAVVVAARLNILRWRSWRARTKLLTPAGPIFEPLAAPFCPLVGRMIRRTMG